MQTYQETIAETLKAMNRTDIDPRHIEGYMRLEHSTLDALSKLQFTFEVETGIMCVDVDGQDNAEKLAKSFAL